MKIKFEVEISPEERILYTLTQRHERSISSITRNKFHSKVDKILETFEED